MKVLLKIVWLFLPFIGVHAQTWDVKIFGTISNMDKERLCDIPVMLISNQDTLEITKSNSNGEFEFAATFSKENSYYVSIETQFQNNRNYWSNLYVPGDTSKISEYHVDLMKLRVVRDRFDTNIYYEINETKEHQNFDIDYFKVMLEEYPQMCIQFRQIFNPKESLHTIRIRMSNFKEELLKSGINMGQLIFIEDEIIPIDMSKTEDKRSSIEGVVHSMDGNCK